MKLKDPWLAVAALALLVIVASPSHAGKNERDYQRELCAGMRMELSLPSGGRVDCLNNVYAIEVDFSEKWHQAIGQSLYYAAETGRQAAIILICRKSMRICLGHSLRLQTTIARWALPITIFECDARARRINQDCSIRLPGGS